MIGPQFVEASNGSPSLIFRARSTNASVNRGTIDSSTSIREAARLMSEWNPEQRDENVVYYLAKLDALVAKFEGIDKGDSQGELGL